MSADAPAGDRGPEQPKQRQQEKPRDAAKKLTPEEREAKRKEIKARLDKRLAELRAKDTNGVLTASEKRELGRCEQILKRFEQSASQPGGKKPAKPGATEEEKGHTCERR